MELIRKKLVRKYWKKCEGRFMDNCLVIFVNMICFVLGLFAAWYFTGHKYCIIIRNLRKENVKNRLLVRLYDVWMMADTKKTIAQYLLEKEIKSVVIYGMSTLGVRLFKKLKNDNRVRVVYALDCNPQINIPGIKIYAPGNEKKEVVDAVIVTAVVSFDGIKKMLLENGYQKIYAIDEVLYEILSCKPE